MGKRNLGFNDLIIYKNEYWIASNRWNGLYSIDRISKKITYISEFPGEKKNQKNLYMRTAIYQGKIIFAPSSAKKIAIYDIEQKNWIMLKIENENIDGKFHDVTIYGRYVFLICHRYPAIVKLDMADYSIQYLDKCIEELKKISKKDFPGFVFCEKISGSRMWVPQFISNIVMELDLETNFYRFIEIQDISRNISGIVKTNLSLYILSDKSIYEINSQNQIIKRMEVDILSEELFCCLISNGTDIFVFSIGNVGRGKYIILDLERQEIKNLFLEKESGQYGNFSCIRKIDGKIYLFSQKNNKLLIFNITTKEHELVDIDYTENILTDNWELEREENNDFMNFLCDIKVKVEDNIEIKKSNLGEEIWNICKINGDKR